MPTKEEISRAKESLRSAQSVAAKWKRVQNHPLERKRALEQALVDLRAARKPLTSYCKSGPRTGRKSKPDEIRQLNSEITKTVERLRSMLNPRSGTPRPQTNTITYQAFDKSCDAAKQAGNELWEEFGLIKTHLKHGEPMQAKGGGIYKSVAELRNEAEEILARLDEVVKTLEGKWKRYAAGQQKRLEAADNPNTVKDEFEAAGARIQAARTSFRNTKKIIKQAARQPEPQQPRATWESHNYYERWTVEDIIDCWVGFHKSNGRWPKKADHCPSNQLPCYPQLLRTVGERPMEKLRSYVGN